MRQNNSWKTIEWIDQSGRFWSPFGVTSNRGGLVEHTREEANGKDGLVGGHGPKVIRINKINACR